MAGSIVKISGNNLILNTAVLDRITAELKPRAREIVNKYGLVIAGEASKNAPVDTSALRNSILSESHMEGDMTFVVQDGVEYGKFVEFGTSKMAARPFLVPAIERYASAFGRALSGLFK